MNWSKISIAAAVVALSLSAGAVGYYKGRESVPRLTVKLDNARVTVTESSTPAGARREPYTRPTDQLPVFIDAADYEATDADGKATVRHRNAGEIVWHSKGEAAPLLVNKGKTYRNMIIAFK